jgi:hypothetical protein
VLIKNGICDEERDISVLAEISLWQRCKASTSDEEFFLGQPRCYGVLRKYSLELKAIECLRNGNLSSAACTETCKLAVWMQAETMKID